MTDTQSLHDFIDENYGMNEWGKDMELDRMLEENHEDEWLKEQRKVA